MGIFNWLQQKAELRLRRSQIKILYQNQAAIEYLLGELRVLEGAGLKGTSSSESLIIFDNVVADAIRSLTCSQVLPNEGSSEQLQINGALKNLYSGWIEGKRAARRQSGSPMGDLAEFAQRFVPASGWDRMSDTEWDRMVAQAIRREP